MTKKVESFRIGPGEMVFAFDGAGKQIPELQLNLLELWAERATKAGYDVNFLVCEHSPLDRWRLMWDVSVKRWMVERA